MVKKKSVVIAGGGIGGLATAVALARRAMDVTVVERSGRMGTQGSGLMLYPNGVRAVDALGAQLGARIRSLGHVTRPDEVRTVTDSAGTVLAQEPIGAMGEELGAPQIPILRSALQRALLDEALAAGAAVMPGTAVEDYAMAGDTVTVLLSAGKTLECGALVAADGIHSAVRRRMLADGPAQYRGYSSVRGRTKGSALGQRSYVVNGRGIQIFIAPVGADTLYWTAKITAPAGLWPAKGPARAQDDLAAALAGWHPPVLRLIRDADPHDIVVTDIHDRDPVPRWVDSRVALLGDAAHPMVPALGQGANMALEDAVVLADAMSAHEDVPAALLAYQRERLERTAAVVLKSRRQGSLDQGAGQAEEKQRNARVKAEGRKDTDAADVLGWRPLARRRERHTKPAVVDMPDRTREEPTTADTPHIVLISGSLRRGSTSDRVADWCAQRCADQGATTRVFNGADIDFPAYRPGLGAAWPDVQDFLDELRRADGVVLVSPTYHGTVSGLLKNAVDYINDLDGPTPYLEGRAIGCVAVGAGAQGAVSTLATLRTIGHAVRAWPTPVGVAVSAAPAPLPAGEPAPTPDGERLVQMVSQLMWMGRVRVAQRPALLGAAA
ncbi:FAD-dependent oxidoreductase [Streptomyces sp. CB00455]|uniref:NAD(P)H-dependent oxidoreductase n=1 Tax=Streptomyces sp. CB00455 TaxID=1703927 RepID=UPI00093DFB26|nr:NAD(P)H-dependent oxidoreductase [Streptomyces sp. CB00455]OKK14262.1 FAD-dependent oxidoreductase [Streptomyces sp. CB00455]